MKFSVSQLGSISCFGEAKVSGAEVFSEIAIRAGSLRRSGVNRGDKVLIFHGNSPEFFMDLLAVWDVGACAACLNPGLTDFELKKIVDFVKPVAILVTKDKMVEECGGIKILSLGSREGEEIGAVDRSEIADDVSIDDDALILFTSGTTGTPKGVVHSYRSLLARISLNQSIIGQEALSWTLCPLPTHFGHGLILLAMRRECAMFCQTHTFLST